MKKIAGGIISARDTTNGYYFKNHSGEQQWTCRLCGKRRNYEDLESHMNAAHFVSLNVLKDFDFIKSLYRPDSESSSSDNSNTNRR